MSLLVFPINRYYGDGVTSKVVMCIVYFMISDKGIVMVYEYILIIRNKNI